MIENVVIQIRNLNKSYYIPVSKKLTVYDHIAGFLSTGKKAIEKKVLNDITLDIYRGECFGIIGENGVGKSTLLQIISGVLYADSGTIKVDGSIIPLLKLGVGFQDDLTARDNIIVYGLMLGFSKKEIMEVYDEIIRFSDLEKYQNLQLKNFSSGMRTRLAFSIAIQINPDIVILDEVLSVGDESFKEKSYEKILELRYSGKTILLVTHSMQTVKTLCNRCMFLHEGGIKAIGEPESVIDEYFTSIARGDTAVHFRGKAQISSAKFNQNKREKRIEQLCLSISEPLKLFFQENTHSDSLNAFLIAMTAQKYLTDPKVLKDLKDYGNYQVISSIQSCSIDPMQRYLQYLSEIEFGFNEDPIGLLMNCFPLGYVLVSEKSEIHYIYSESGVDIQISDLFKKRYQVSLLSTEDTIIPCFFASKKALSPNVELIHAIFHKVEGGGFPVNAILISIEQLTNSIISSLIQSNIPYLIPLRKDWIINEPSVVKDIRKTRNPEFIRKYENRTIFCQDTVVRFDELITKGHLIIDDINYRGDLSNLYSQILQIKKEISLLHLQTNNNPHVIQRKIADINADIFTDLTFHKGYAHLTFDHIKIAEREDIAGSNVIIDGNETDCLFAYRLFETQRKIMGALFSYYLYKNEQDPSVRCNYFLRFLRDIIELNMDFVITTEYNDL